MSVFNERGYLKDVPVQEVRRLGYGLDIGLSGAQKVLRKKQLLLAIKELADSKQISKELGSVLDRLTRYTM